jgi:hypothetical protein
LLNFSTMTCWITHKPTSDLQGTSWICVINCAFWKLCGYCGHLWLGLSRLNKFASAVPSLLVDLADHSGIVGLVVEDMVVEMDVIALFSLSNLSLYPQLVRLPRVM